MRSILCAVALLCFSLAESGAQYSNDFDSWPIIAAGSWSQPGPGGTWRGSGVYVNFGNEHSGLRKVGFNNVGDKLELPPVENADVVTYYARLSSGSLARIRLEYDAGHGWKTVNTVSISNTSYRRYRGSPMVAGENVRLRLRMTSYGNSVYLDDVEVETFILPVELADFTATPKDDQTVHLEWRTLTETNNDRFDIQRSQDGSSFQTIGVVEGAGTTGMPNSYAFRDEAPFPGISYYRLSQVDFDGSTSLSPVRSVQLRNESADLRLSPGIITQTLQVELSPATKDRSLIVFNRQGRIVHRESIPQGGTFVRLEMGGLAPGLYFLNVEGEVRRFVKM